MLEERCPRLLVTGPRGQCGLRLVGRSVREGPRTQDGQSGDCDGLCSLLLNVKFSCGPWPPAGPCVWLSGSAAAEGRYREKISPHKDGQPATAEERRAETKNSSIPSRR